MKILIIEDEYQALKRIQKLILEVIPTANIIGTIGSVEEAINWFLKTPMPDLLFLDIQLADGSSFHIFEEVKITCPIIFTTAHEDYALQAFKVNSIDYLLKPINKEDVQLAFDKLSSLQNFKLNEVNYSEILKNVQDPEKNYKERFVIKLGDSIKIINIDEIAYFYTENKANFLCTKEGKRLPIDFNLDKTEQLLNPKKFFRINRQFIINQNAIASMKAHTRSRIIITLMPPTKLNSIVAIDRAHNFKKWLSN